jgi:hypothetical protein
MQLQFRLENAMKKRGLSYTRASPTRNCFILSHSESFWPILCHSSSFCFILFHFIILCHSESFYFNLTHSVSFCFILSHSASLISDQSKSTQIKPNQTKLCANDTQTIRKIIIHRICNKRKARREHRDNIILLHF